MIADPKGTSSRSQPPPTGPEKSQQYWDEQVGDHLQSFLQRETRPHVLPQLEMEKAFLR